MLECTVGGTLIDTRGQTDEGMVIDFGVLKAVMTNIVAEPWDHALLIWMEDQKLLYAMSYLGPDHKTVILKCIPTVENLAQLAFELLEPHLKNYGIQLTNVRLYETPNCFADYSRS